MQITSRSVQETLKIGNLIARNAKSSDIICLFGELGSGKTVFTKGIAQGLKLKKDKVNSPSFVLLRQYDSGIIPLYHFDLYRLNNPEDIQAIGYEEYLYGEGISVIEWADRLHYLLPKEYLKVELSIESYTKRLIKFTAFGLRYQQLLKRVYENIRN